jgi:hypothetical protein
VTLLTHSLIHSLTHPLTHSLIHSPGHSYPNSLSHSFIHSLINLLIHSLIHSPGHSCPYLLTQSFTHSSILSFIHSFICSLILIHSRHLWLCSLTHPFIHYSLMYSFILSLTDSLIHSHSLAHTLTHSFNHASLAHLLACSYLFIHSLIFRSHSLFSLHCIQSFSYSSTHSSSVWFPAVPHSLIAHWLIHSLFLCSLALLLMPPL